jgi:ectoine hydroxylase-related dioxygenase (phytanoyl-CoA dioxygenase family)
VSQIEDDIARMHERGFVVFESLLSAAYLERIRQALAPYLGGEHYGRNDFEGRRTQRVYAVLAKTTELNELILHPRIIGLLDRLLFPNYLITAAQAIRIDPGETPQAFHHDDQFTFLPRPRAPVSYATIWAIDEFTRDNGGTVVIPGSHLWGDDAPIDTAENFALEMPPGSVVFFPSTLWHGGGANVSNGSRLAVSIQYCQPYMRPQENQFLAVPLEMARRHPEQIQTMMGYSIHPPFIGHTDGLHPARLLGTYDPSMRRERGIA